MHHVDAKRHLLVEAYTHSIAIQRRFVRSSGSRREGGVIRLTLSASASDVRPPLSAQDHHAVSERQRHGFGPDTFAAIIEAHAKAKQRRARVANSAGALSSASHGCGEAVLR
ncbi:hypothetical protein ACJBUE_14085 [Ralstonia syzygii subsp. celebesensis]|uniref:hypothetical protein n=1 Tax=Ralstonia syzygii TaxID=28097 RepID=UPI0012FE52FF|nr:hypothetical protein [Ralstonia syzygii]QQV54934.1 hypothetical protein JK151_12540 [Ralstonia syzygii subsp. celebesensis]